MKMIVICLMTAMIAGCASPMPKPRAAKRTMNAEKIINYDLGIDAQLDSLARQITIQLGQNPCGRLAISGFFDVKGRMRRLEKYITIEFTNRLLRTGRFEIHAPQDRFVPEENRLATSLTDGSYESSRLPVSGNSNMDELDSYLIGSTVEFPQAVKVSVRIISSRTGSVYGTASVMIHKDKVVESLLDNFGVKKFASFGNSNFRVGEVIKTGDNQYVDLIPGEYVLYVKQINFEYTLFSDSFSNVEIFLNEDFRVMKLNDMISINYQNERYVLALRDVANSVAVFTFARLNDGRCKSTDPFSLTDQAPYYGEKPDPEAENEHTSTPLKQEEPQNADPNLVEPATLKETPDNEKSDTTPPVLKEKMKSKNDTSKT